MHCVLVSIISFINCKNVPHLFIVVKATKSVPFRVLVPEAFLRYVRGQNAKLSVICDDN